MVLPSQRVEADLRARLDANDWQPGQQLPTTRALAAHYGVSGRAVSMRHLWRSYGPRSTSPVDQPGLSQQELSVRTRPSGPAGLMQWARAPGELRWTIERCRAVSG
jgi:hypothetical protein